MTLTTDDWSLITEVVAVRAVVQRVSKADVRIQNESVGSIGRGLLVFLGIGKQDTARDIDWMVDKIVNLRIFETQEGKMDESLLDIGGDLLLVSQFTLYGDCRKGRRPSFSDAMDANAAKSFFELFVQRAKEKVANVQTGVFQAMMYVALTNDGPVTILLDSNMSSSSSV
ncbi:MAG TPA: D-aminoacyl-tRNA deacylase [Syntrophorhabdales bacterium]|nr:D-aminoacyl-tRNA deacylase [Syntrophorhabdales bacterium]